MAVKSTNTQAEVLQSMLGDISVTKALPDADLQFLVELETMILQKIRQPLDQASGQLGPNGPTPGPLPPGAGPGPMTSGMPPGLPPGPGPEMAGPGVPGLRSPGPAPDELARLLG